MAEKLIKVIANENGVGGYEVRKGDVIEIPESSLEPLKNSGEIVEVPKEKEAPKQAPKDDKKKK